MVSPFRSFTRRTLLVALLLGLLAACRLISGGKRVDVYSISFPPQPRLERAADEMKTSRTSPARKRERDRLVRRGEGLLKHPIHIPKDPRGGQWLFYYACPKEGSRLRMKTKTEHVCPKCGTVYSNERVNAAYRAKLYLKADSRMHNLALAYAASGDDKFAVPVRDAFLELVDLYPKLERHDRWGRKGVFAVVGGRRFCQHLSEATSVIKLAKSYDLCADSVAFSDAEREKIETELLEKIVDEINSLSLFVGGRNNHQTWFNAAFANVGVAIGNKDLIDLAVNGPHGLLWQLENSVTDDGIWYEGTISYHFYALMAIIETLKALERVGVDLSDNSRLKSLWIGPLSLAYPNGRMPAINDGDAYDLHSQSERYRFALDYFDDPVFKPLAEAKKGESNVPVRQSLKSGVLDDIGLAVLRRGSNPDATCLFLDYGIHGGHHGHPDKLNIILFCLGEELILDPGRISYSAPEHTSWCRTTLAHNTVVMNKQSQAPARGRLLFFTSGEAFDACLGECDGAYPDVNLKRFLLLTDHFLVDWFLVKKDKILFGADSALWDWIVHCRGNLKTDSTTSESSKQLGIDDGYQHLTKVIHLDAEKNDRVDFTQKDGRKLRLHVLDETGDVYAGAGIGVKKSEKVPFLLRRRAAAETSFLTIYDFSGDATAVETIHVLDAKDLNGSKQAQALGLRIKGAAGTFLLGLDARNDRGEALTVNGHSFKNAFVKSLKREKSGAKSSRR